MKLCYEQVLWHMYLSDILGRFLGGVPSFFLKGSWMVQRCPNLPQILKLSKDSQILFIDVFPTEPQPCYICLLETSDVRMRNTK